MTERDQAARDSSRLAAIVESSDDAIIGKDLSSIITSWNRGAERIFGYTAAEMVGTSITRLIPADRQDEEALILGRIRRGECVNHFETLRQTREGRLIDVSVTASPIKDASGRIVGVSKIARVITLLKEREREIARLTRLYAALSEVNQAIVRMPTRDQLFQKVCRVLVEHGGFRMAWIGWYEPETRRLVPVAEWGADHDELQSIEVYADDRPEGRGPSGRAFLEGRSYICNDMVNDPATLPWRAELERSGFRASAAFPVRLKGEKGGTLSVYADEPWFFQDREIALVEEAASDVSFALDNLARDEERKRAEEALRETEDQLRTVMENLTEGLVIFDLDGGILHWNRAGLDMYGFADFDEVVHSFPKFNEIFELSTLEGKALALSEWPLRRIIRGEMLRDEEFAIRRRGSAWQRIFRYSGAIVHAAAGRSLAYASIEDISARKESEAALQDSEGRFRALVEWSPDAIAVQRGGKLIFVNPAAIRMFGAASEQDLVGRPILDIVHPDFHQIARARLKDNSSHGGMLPMIEVRFVKLDGSPIDVEVQGISIIYDGEPATLASLRNITERKRAEVLLRTSEELYHSLFNYAPDGIVIVDRQSYYRDANPSMCRMLGYTRDELIGVHASDIVTVTEVNYIGLTLDVLKTGSDSHHEWEFRRKDGSVFQAEVMATALPDGNLLCLIRDITERREAEFFLLKLNETLQEKMLQLEETNRSWRRDEADLRLRDCAIRAVSSGIIITDHSLPDDPIIYANPSFERMTGYTADEIIGRNCRFLQGKDTDPATVAQLRESLRAGRDCTVELLNYHRDGTPFWNSLTISAVVGPDGEITHFVGVQTDVTERRRLGDQFRQAQKMEAVGQLAGGIAHDFNNLLMVISTCTEVLLKASLTEDRRRGLLEEIRKAVERSASLTRQLLAFSRKQVLAPRVLDLNRLVLDIEKMLRRVIGEDVELTTVLHRDTGNVRADVGQLEQVILNLSVNARDAMPQGGKLTIETNNVELDETYTRSHPGVRAGWYVMLAVSDTGPGMTEAVKGHLFEPCFTTKELGKGTGLGLSVVLGIVQQSGGAIEVYSELGLGTAFKIYLPRIEEVVAPAKSQATLGAAQHGTETILLVEDEEVVRRLIRSTLEDQGYKVLEAGHGEEGLSVAAAHQGPIHLLVTDVVMPGMGGQILAERLSVVHPEMKVLYVSGYTDDAVVRHGILHEEVNFLQKPCSPTALAHKIREVLTSDGGRAAPPAPNSDIVMP